MSARDEILARVRGALADVPAAESIPVPRGYRDEPAAGIVERFAERAAEYRATVRRTDEVAIPDVVRAICVEHRARRLVVPADLPTAWRPDGVSLVEDDGSLGPRELDALDGVITGCAAAVAETGTVALDAGAAQGRRAITLIPDLHVCILRVEQVVAGMSALMAALERAARDERRPITLIAGPSATSDIELQRVEGVHGPRRLEIVLAE